MAVKRKKLAPLPRVTSKTITGGALLRKIKRLILAKPKRLDMGDWIKAFHGEILNTDVHQVPACGTVACVAGWGAILMRPSKSIGETIDGAAADAMNLAIGYEQDGEIYAGDLFSCETSRAFKETSYMPAAGTPEHAAVIAKRIDTYLAQHPEVEKRVIVVADIQKMLRA